MPADVASPRRASNKRSLPSTRVERASPLLDARPSVVFPRRAPRVPAQVRGAPASELRARPLRGGILCAQRPGRCASAPDKRRAVRLQPRAVQGQAPTTGRPRACNASGPHGASGVTGRPQRGPQFAGNRRAHGRAATALRLPRTKFCTQCSLTRRSAHSGKCLLAS